METDEKRDPTREFDGKTGSNSKNHVLDLNLMDQTLKEKLHQRKTPSKSKTYYGLDEATLQIYRE